MFRLTAAEKAEVVTNCDHLANLKFSPVLPHAFTEHGALMLGNVLKSERAVEVSLTQSEKAVNENGGWRHSRITLNPSSTDPGYKPLVLEGESDDEVAVIAEMVAVLG